MSYYENINCTTSPSAPLGGHNSRKKKFVSISCELARKEAQRLPKWYRTVAGEVEVRCDHIWGYQLSVSEHECTVTPTNAALVYMRLMELLGPARLC